MLSPETIKFLEENMLFDIDVNNIFHGLSPQLRATRAKINKQDYLKLKNFWTLKKKKTTK